MSRDNATGIFNGQGHGNPQFRIDENQMVSGGSFREYKRSDGSTYKLPMDIRLTAARDYQHTLLINRYSVDLVGVGFVDGHVGRIVGSASVLKYGNGEAILQLVVGKDSKSTKCACSTDNRDRDKYVTENMK